MKKLNLFFALILGLFIFSCSSDDEGPIDSTPDYTGTYTLISIESNIGLDPDVSGSFDDTEILDNISCSSLLILNADNSFSWDYLGFGQIVNNIMDVITYTEIECFDFSGGNGTYTVNNNGIVFNFDPSASISDTNASINETMITVSINEELAVENNGVIQLQNVQLTLTYEK